MVPRVRFLTFAMSRLLRSAILFTGIVVLAQIALPNSADAAQSNAACVDLTGCWDCGSWTSATTGHTGCLRAGISRIDACHYRCTFCGTFCKLIPFRYTVTLHVTGYENGRVHFWASKRLPLFGGTFTCRGVATNRSFQANFAAQDDRGTFALSR